MRWVIAAVFLGACSHPAPKRAATAEEPVTGTATIAGTWLMNDDLDWSYRLVLVPDGRFGLAVDRGKMGGCEQRGRLVQGKGPSTFQLTLTRDTCSKTGAVGGSLTVSVASFTGNAMTLSYLVNGSETRRMYQRDPKVPRAQ